MASCKSVDLTGAHLVGAAVAAAAATAGVAYLVQRRGLFASLGAAAGGKPTEETEKKEVNTSDILFHYGTPQDACPFDKHRPERALQYLDRCALLIEQNCEALLDFTGEREDPIALDLGCGLGGASFLLSRAFKHVLGIDESAAKVAFACQLKDQRSIAVPGEPRVKLDEDCDVDRVRFIHAVTTAPPPEMKAFDAVLLSTPLEELPDMSKSLAVLPKLVAPGGVVLLAADGEQPLSNTMAQLGFTRVACEDVPRMRRTKGRRAFSYHVLQVALFKKNK